MPRNRIGDILCERGQLSPEARDQVLREQEEQKAKERRRFGTILIEQGLIQEEIVYRALAELFGLNYLDLDALRPSPDAGGLLPPMFIRQKRILPVSVSNGLVTIAFDDKPDYAVVRDIRFITGLEVRVTLTRPSALDRAVQRHLSPDVSYDQILQMASIADAPEQEPDAVALEKATEAAPVVALVNAVLTDALRREASDIHIQPEEDRLRVRFRVDGRLQEAMDAPVDLRYAVLSRIKVMAKLDISERRVPQDGRVRMRLDDGRAVDLRVSTVPTLLGEKAVIRILGQGSHALNLGRLGFDPSALEHLRAALTRPNGMVLVTGPTGSGKTTTLYAALKELNDPAVNICTAEDPIEYRMPGATQVQVNEETGVTFASCLRAFLRQDPDVILVGEIRDYETAEIAVKAALTGHILLSTLHTNDAAATVSRLLNMGVEPFLVASSLNAVVAQRLVRKICESCRETWTPPSSSLLALGDAVEGLRGIPFYRGGGCEHCGDSGYQGRVAVYEVLPLDDVLTRAILDQLPDVEIRRMARSRGMKTLRESALERLRSGATTLEEVMRLTPPDAKEPPARHLQALGGSAS